MLANIPQDIRKEFIVDREGKVFAKNKSAVSRLAGIHKDSVTWALDKVTKAGATGELPKTLEPLRGMSFQGATAIPDIAVSCIINYYAWESKQTVNDVARETAMAMAAVGFRAWFQHELGWKPQQPAIMSHVEALRAYADVLEQKDKLETKHPGLKHLNGDSVPVEGLEPSFSVREWLDFKGYAIDLQERKNFGKLVANTKRTLKQLDYRDDVAQNNRYYTYADLDLLDTSWLSFNDK